MEIHPQKTAKDLDFQELVHLMLTNFNLNSETETEIHQTLINTFPQINRSDLWRLVVALKRCNKEYEKPRFDRL